MEIIVYVALWGAIAVVIANFLIRIVGAYRTAQTEREVLSTARLLLQTIGRAASEAQAVYTPTSRFNTNLGQLSLITAASTTPYHATSYIDFWLDSGRFWMRQEGGISIPLSSPSVQVSRFYLEQIAQGLARPSIKITLEVDSLPTSVSSSAVLNFTTALRGAY